MIRWLIATVIALLLFSSVMPWLRKLGIGRLPGDLNFRMFGRDVSIPLASTILLSLMAMALSKLF